MSGQAWLVDSNRIATKIKSASGAYDPAKVQWTSNPTKSCPNCQFEIDNNDVPHAWPGLPRGVKFDPTDQEIIWHLLAKVGVENVNSHPFIDEFIPTVEEVGGICYTHPQNLPGVKQDGSVAHFFHRAIKAYSTGTRKRRKIHGDDCGDVRWHKTGRTKPVVIDGVQKGCKKIMVLYVSPIRGGKAEKTNWVMHQYHLGTGEDEKEGEYVLSKVFYQQQAVKHIERGEEEISEGIDTMTAKVDPVTPKSVTPEPRAERRFSEYVSLEDSTVHTIEHIIDDAMEDELEAPTEQSNDQNQNNVENYVDQVGDQGNGEADQVRDQGNDEADHAGDQGTDEADEGGDQGNDEADHGGDQGTDEADEGGDQGNDEASQVLWDSQMFMNSQQLVEGLSICDEFFESQSPNRDEAGGGQGVNRKPRLADYARLGPEDLKRDLEECQNLASDTENIDIDTPPDFRLSQLEFASQDSYIAWGGSFQGGRVID